MDASAELSFQAQVACEPAPMSTLFLFPVFQVVVNGSLALSLCGGWTACLYWCHCRRRFGSLVDLVPMADSVVKLTARCQVCGQDAIFTLRKTRDMRTELVGGADVYMPVCRKHYLGAKSLVGSLPDVPQEEDSSITAK